MNGARDVDLELQARLFARTWALAVLFDRLARGTTVSWSSALLTLAALGVLVRPSLPALATLAVVHLGWLALEAPRQLHVHWYLAGVVHVAMLGAAGHALRREGRGAGLAAFLRSFGGTGRALLLAALFSAGFAKLNSSFLDPRYSCGAELYLFQREQWPFALLPDADWAKRAAIWLTLSAELGGPLCLLLPPLRLFGAALATGFLLLIGLNPQGSLYEFSALFVSLLTLFAPPELWRRAVEILRSSTRRVALLAHANAVPRSWLVRLLALLLLAYFSVYADHDLLAAHERETLCRALHTGVAGACVATYAAGLWARARPAPLLSGARALLVLPALLLLHEATVYAGFKHMPTLAMAANLRMARGGANHLLIREPPHLRANRVARLLWSSDRRLQPHGRSGILSSALEDFISRNRRAKLRYELDGVRYEVRTRKDARRMGKRSFWAALLSRGNPARRFGTPAVFAYDAEPKRCHHRVTSYRARQKAHQAQLAAARTARARFFGL